LVVGHDDDKGKFLHAGLIECFVHGTGGRGAVPYAGKTDRALASLHAAREQHAVDDGNHRAQMADHGQQTFLRPAAVDISVAAPHRTEGGAEVGSHCVENGFTEGEPAGLITDAGGKNIALRKARPAATLKASLAASEKTPP